MINNKDSIIQRTAIIGLLTLLTFALYFFRMQGFGLYEDDYSFVGSFIGLPGSDIYLNTINCLREMPQGRPLAFLFPAIVTYFGVNLTDDLIIVYSIGALFCAANAFFVYSILRNWISLPSALIGALLFLLSPSDTTKILLTHNLILQPSLFCALLGIIFYTKSNRLYLFPAYLFGAMTLLFYESGILVFLFAPFFVINNKNSFIKRLLVHITLIALTIICLYLIRASQGESRVNDLIAGSKLELIFRILTGPFIGIGGSLAAMTYGTLKGIQKALVIEIVPIIIAGIGFTFWLLKYFLKAGKSAALNSVIIVVPEFLQRIFKNNRFLPLKIKELFAENNFSIRFPAYILFVGALMIPAAYLLAFTHYPPITLSGRLTSVHLPSTVAWAVFLGGLIEFLLTSEIRRNLKSLIVSMIGVVLILWSSYAVYIQDGYYTVWQGQKIFWKEVTTLTPDMNKNATVVFDKNIVDYSRTWCFGRNIIGGADWSLPTAFSMYMGNQFELNRPVVIKSIEELIWQKSDDKIRFFNVSLPTWGVWTELDTAQTIFFSMNEEGDLQRVQKMSVYNYQLPIYYTTIDGLTYAKPSTELPPNVISGYYHVRGNQPEYFEEKGHSGDYIDIQFEKMSYTTNLSSFKPNGCLKTFMETGKFGLMK